MSEASEPKAKAHRARQAGPKAKRKVKRDKEKRGVDEDLKGKNPKAFGVFNSARRAAKGQQRMADLESRKQHVPVPNRAPDEPAPFVIVVVGPPGSGKTSVIKSLVKHYTKHNLRDVKGPITVVTGKKARLTLFECPNDMNAMCDLAKIADLVLLLVDASFGFEMEVFEFLNILKVHGFPKVMGVLTHLDRFDNNKKLTSTKKTLKHRFWTEICDGAKLFYLSGLINGSYPKREILNLARFISVIKFRPLIWRNSHPYVLADRVEDITSEALIQENPKANRTVALFGYVRGTYLKPQQAIHLLGVGDYLMDDLKVLPDPCPLTKESKGKIRALNEKEKRIYAPMADIGDVMYDNDAVYITLRKNHVNFTKPEDIVHEANPSESTTNAIAPRHMGEGETMVRGLQDISTTLDQAMADSEIKLFKTGAAIKAKDVVASSKGSGEYGVETVTDAATARVRRKVVFDNDVPAEALQGGDEDEGADDGDLAMMAGDDGDNDEDENEDGKGYIEAASLADDDDDDTATTATASHNPLVSPLPSSTSTRKTSKTHPANPANPAHTPRSKAGHASNAKDTNADEGDPQVAETLGDDQMHDSDSDYGSSAVRLKSTPRSLMTSSKPASPSSSPSAKSASKSHANSTDKGRTRTRAHRMTPTDEAEDDDDTGSAHAEKALFEAAEDELLLLPKQASKPKRRSADPSAAGSTAKTAKTGAKRPSSKAPSSDEPLSARLTGDEAEAEDDDDDEQEQKGDAMRDDDDEKQEPAEADDAEESGGGGGTTLLLGDDEDEDEADRGDQGLQWKDNLVQRAVDSYKSQVNLMEVVYGNRAIPTGAQNGSDAAADGLTAAPSNTERALKQLFDDDDGDDNDDGDGGDSGEGGGDFFTVKSGPKAKLAKAARSGFDGDIDALDCNRVVLTAEGVTVSAAAAATAAGVRPSRVAVAPAVRDYDDPEVYESLRNRFVTGDWSATAGATAGRDATDGGGGAGGGGGSSMEEAIRRMGMDDDITGGDGGDGDDGEDHGITVEDDEHKQPGGGKPESAAEAEQRRAAAKEKLKAAFDDSYDDKKSSGGGGKRGRKGGKGGDDADAAAAADEKEEGSFFDQLKDEQTAQARVNKAEFAHESEYDLFLLQGARAGTYVRIQLSGVPYEFVRHLDVRFPVVAGGLLAHERQLGFVQVRIKKHRWFKKVLKTNDPMVFSVGWRRFQSLPVYSMEDRTGRLRFLKYTPEHMHCMATLYGPITPPNTGLIAFQNTATQASFRATATGNIVELDQSVKIVKKLKLVGKPVKIFKNTAFIQGMFNSALEVAKFEGAKVKTVSGIRGAIKKALTTEGHPGTFRATFEDKILFSDIVFCRTWTEVQPEEYYNPVTSLLQAQHAKAGWKGMRPVAEIRREGQLPVPFKADSEYPAKKIEHKERRFNPLRIPKSTLQNLPFAQRPKLMKARASSKATLEQRRAVALEPEERKSRAVMQQINALRSDKLFKRKQQKQKQRTEYLKKKDREEAKHAGANREQRKRRYISTDKVAKKKQRISEKREMKDD